MGVELRRGVELCVGDQMGAHYPEPHLISIDRDGVGELMRMAVINARSVSPDIKIGICGEHGGDPASIAFCQELGMSYVSCSPYRIPVARLAAAQSAAKNL